MGSTSEEFFRKASQPSKSTVATAPAPIPAAPPLQTPAAPSTKPRIGIVKLGLIAFAIIALCSGVIIFIKAESLILTTALKPSPSPALPPSPVYISRTQAIDEIAAKYQAARNAEEYAAFMARVKDDYSRLTANGGRVKVASAGWPVDKNGAVAYFKGANDEVRAAFLKCLNDDDANLGGKHRVLGLRNKIALLKQIQSSGAPFNKSCLEYFESALTTATNDCNLRQVNLREQISDLNEKIAIATDQMAELKAFDAANVQTQSNALRHYTEVQNDEAAARNAQRRSFYSNRTSEASKVATTTLNEACRIMNETKTLVTKKQREMDHLQRALQAHTSELENVTY